jgi:polar amino acid transport system substrate-binding protein
MMRAVRRLLVVIALVAGVGGAVAGAVVLGGDESFEALTAGTLTVATSEVPAAGFWEGRDADRVTGGFEDDLARALADELGLDRVAVVTRPFDDLVDGSATGFDVALAQISITRERSRRLDLSQPYLTTPVAVVGRAGADEVPDLATARELRWGVAEATTEADLVADLIRPDDDPRTYPDAGDALAAVRAGEVDVAAVDFVRGLAEVDAEPPPVRWGWDEPAPERG